MTKKDTLRGRFEEWAKSEGYTVHRDCEGKYVGSYTQSASDGFDEAVQAAQPSEAEIEELARACVEAAWHCSTHKAIERRIAEVLRGKLGGTTK